MAETVAPLAGAWIEIVPDDGRMEPRRRSLPSRERGLKLYEKYSAVEAKSRSPRGSVD